VPSLELWSVDSAGCPPAQLAVLDGEEQERHVVAAGRGRPGYGAGRAALRILLGARLEIAPERVVFARHCASCERNGHGRPAVAGVGPRELDFSVATAGTVTVIALVRQGTVGVDVERVPADGTAFWPRPSFNARERQALERLAESERPEAIARSWVRKEAVAKFVGRGLALPLQSVEVAGDPQHWRLPDPLLRVADLELGPPFVAAVAHDGKAAVPVVQEWAWGR
jgi:4'-phosphopantetheinyl transferase